MDKATKIPRWTEAKTSTEAKKIQFNIMGGQPIMSWTHITRKKQTHGTGREREREDTHTQPGAQSALDTPSAMDIRIPLIYRKKEKKKKKKNTWRDM